MHLKQIKLAGFKSFVDPTVIPLPSCLVGVVGPNGCGKSNIIDAIRWVMGESLAKTLRGESMTDVIFKGSSHRKPIGQASVELIFDHHQGRLQGPWAQYKEISVKRMVTHQGDSTFFLNGTRCRRRDVTDLFLGTGLGARSYSIIGQDTISRLIMAHPDDLRAYLEEAAGVSKYKTSRAQTLTRMHQARENLERVALVREELRHQVVSLEEQARHARRYQTLKQEERGWCVHQLARQWQEVTHELLKGQEDLVGFVAEHEHHQQRMMEHTKARETLLQSLQQVGDEQNQWHTECLSIEKTIHQIETQMAQCTKEKERLQAEQRQAQSDLSHLLAQCQDAQVTQSQHEQHCVLLNEQRQGAQQALRLQEQQAAEEQQAALRWQENYTQQQAHWHQVKQELQVEHVHLAHLEQQQNQGRERLRVIENECRLLLENEPSASGAALEQTHQINLQCWHDAQKRQDAQREKTTQLRRLRAHHEQELHRLNDALHVVVMEHAALMATQRGALGRTPDASARVFPWQSKACLVDVMQVDDDWMRIAEALFADDLHATVVENIHDWLMHLPGNTATPLMLMEAPVGTAHAAPWPRFVDKIQGMMPSGPLDWSSVFAVETLDEARQCLSTLRPNESVVTRDGYWLSPHWIKIFAFAATTDDGLLARQKKLHDLDEQLATARAQCEEATRARDTTHAACIEQENALSRAQEHLTDCQQACVTSESLWRKEVQATQWRQMSMNRFKEEQQNLLAAQKAQEVQWQNLQAHTQKLQQRVEENTQQQTCLLQEKTARENEQHGKKSARHEARTALEQFTRQYDRSRALYQNARDLVQQLTYQQQAKEAVIAQCTRQLQQDLQPDSSFEERLTQAKTTRAQLEQQLTQAREQQALLYQHMSDLEHVIQQEEKKSQRQQSKHQQASVQVQVLMQKQAALMDEFKRFETTPTDSVHALPDLLSSQDIAQHLVSIAEQLTQLGAINLLAIEAYQVELARQENMEQQYHDLTQALETLELAIQKLDQETENRFQETFLQVNEAFQSLFPRLFGGGTAQLQLNCDNLLEAGVLVSVQPPGKRHSTIHMLSGGEKALTAIALVFAIFQLNPSPFCLLDEVDAPLDDLNVHRFCALVKEMSSCVQFLFITHNKTTMMLADQLIGVTMQEPGVSCIVSVDVETMIGVE